MTEEGRKAWNEAIDRCLAEIRAQRDVFLSPEYATGQPLSSFSERFACTLMERRIAALASSEAEPSGHQ